MSGVWAFSINNERKHHIIHNNHNLKALRPTTLSQITNVYKIHRHIGCDFIFPVQLAKASITRSPIFDFKLTYNVESVVAFKTYRGPRRRWRSSFWAWPGVLLLFLSSLVRAGGRLPVRCYFTRSAHRPWFDRSRFDRRVCAYRQRR